MGSVTWERYPPPFAHATVAKVVPSGFRIEAFNPHRANVLLVMFKLTNCPADPSNTTSPIRPAVVNEAVVLPPTGKLAVNPTLATV